MSVDLKVGFDDKYWMREVERGRKMAQKAMDKGGGLNLKINEKGFRQPLGRITGDLKQFDSALAASNARVIAFGASTAVIGGISKAFKDLAKTTVEVAKQFADINRILGMSSKGLEQFGNQLFQISKKNATAFQDTTKAALEFARQGLQTEETLKRTSDALTLVRLTGINADKAVSSLTATVNAFDNAMVTTTSSVNKFVAVETKFAVGARDLVEAIGRVGSSAKDAKVGFDELNAIVTSVQQTTGRGGAVIGNAMKTIFTRLQRQSTLDALESYNVAVRDIQGATLPAIQILDNFAQSYKGLSDSSQAYLREQVAGVFQANILSAVLKDLGKQQSTFSSALKVSKNATNEANLATEELNKTLSALVTQTGIEFQRLQQNIGKATFEPIAKGLLEPLKGFLKDINDVIDGEGAGSEIANGLLKGIRNVIGGPGLVAIVGLLGKVFLNTTSYLLKSLPALAGITTETQKRAQLEQVIATAMQTEAGLADLIAKEEGNAAKQAGIFAAFAEDAKNDLDQQEASIRNIAAMLARMPKGTFNTVMAAGGQGKGGRRGASGFIPGIAGEANDISRGVGGVSRSAKPVVIPNFAFGGGVRGTMIANTGEHIVPNFKGGGSAIFNPNMIAQYGMPAGAKPIRGAGGYVPNFVDVNKLAKFQGRGFASLSSAEVDELSTLTGRSAATIKSQGVKSTLAGASKISAGQKAQEARMFNSTGFADMLVPTRGHKSSKVLKFTSPDKIKKYGTEGVIFNRRGIANNAENQLSNLVKIDEVLDDSIVSAANTVISSIHPEFVKKIPVSERELQPFMSKEGAPGAIAALKGAFFEALIGRMVNDKNATPDGMTLDTVMSPAVKKLFVGGMKTSARFGDFKGSVSQGNDGKFAEQVLKNRGRAAGGYVPNFAALGAAVEREAAAGVPVGAIRINRSSKLVTPNNPAGLAVTNTRDEPRGLRDVVGASRGYVPNYAAPVPLAGGSNAITQKFLEDLGLAGKKLRTLAQSINSHAGSLKKGEMNITTFDKKIATAGRKAGLTGDELGRLQKQAAGAAQGLTMMRGGAGGAGGVPGVPAAGGSRFSRFMSGQGGMVTSMGLTMGLPMAAGALEQAGAPGTVTGAMNAAGTGAAFGMIFGPMGAAAGAAAGALYGFTDELTSGEMSLEEMRKAADDFRKSSKETESAAQGYIQAQKDMLTASSQTELEDAQKRLAENFEKIKGTELEKSFASAAGDISKMEQAAKDFTAFVKQEQNILDFSARITEMGRSGFKKAGLATKTTFSAKDQNDPESGYDRVGGGIVAGKFASSKQFQPFLEMLATGTDAQLRAVGEALQAETKAYTFFNADIVEKAFREIPAFRDLGTKAMTSLISAFDEDEELAKAFAGGFGENQVTGLIKIVEAYKKIQGANDGLARQVDDASTKAQEALESFVRTKSSITRMAEIMGQLAQSIENINKVSKAFESQRIDIMRSSGLGLSVGAFAGGQASDTFQRGMQSLDIKTFRDNAERIAQTLRDTQAATSDEELRKLQLASDLFSRDVQAGINAYRKFTTESVDGQEKITKLLNAIEMEYKQQRLNLQLDQKITQAKIQLEQQRAENIEREKILQGATQGALNRRALNALDVDKGRQISIARIQSRMEDPRFARGLGRTGRMRAMQFGQQRVADIEFQRSKSAQLEENINKAKEILIQKDVINSNLSLIDTQTTLNETLQELIFEMNKQKDLTALGVRPDLSIEDAQRFGYATVADAKKAGVDKFLPGGTPAQSAFDAKKSAIMNRKFSGVNRKAVMGSFDATADIKAGTALSSKLEGLRTQEQVLSMLNQEEDLIRNKEGAYNTEEQAMLRRIERLKEEINLGEKRLNTEKEIADEIRALNNERDLSLDKDAKSFKSQFTQGMLDIYEETDYIYGRLGRDLPTAFRDGMVNALEVSLDKAETFGDAMRGVAIDMLKMIRRASLEYSMSNFTNLLGMGDSGFRNSQNGGIIKARNGMYISGNRTGDRNPALLEDGEYVLNRKAVRGMGGKAVLDSLNFGSFPRFSNGGSMMLNESIKSSRMSGFFLASDNPELEEAREAERARLARKEAKKAEKKQLLSTFLTTIATVGVGKLSGMAADKFGKKTGRPTDAAGNPLIGPLREDGTFQRGGHISAGFTNRDSVPAYMAGGEFVMNNRAVRKYGLGFMGRLNGGLIPTMQAGGMVGAESAPLNAQTAANTNNISINVTVGGGGSGGGQGGTEGTGNANASQRTNVDQATQGKELSERIRGAVLEVIQQEQRLGGSLSQSSRQ
ncbi:MAG: phage tail tape measure protein [Crocinitomicaceae bacterium]|nr:phage tail tape measure protein [Crocinitomicaceae bacterium]